MTDLKCPICDTPLYEHGDELCLHNWIAALDGKWVKPYKQGTFGEGKFGYYYQGYDDGFISSWWKTVPNYTDPEHVWPMLVELWRQDNLDLIRCTEEVGSYYRGGGVTEVFGLAWLWFHKEPSTPWKPIAGWSDTPELAVVKAWIAMESESAAVETANV